MHLVKNPDKKHQNLLAFQDQKKRKKLVIFSSIKIKADIAILMSEWGADITVKTAKEKEKRQK